MPITVRNAGHRQRPCTLKVWRQRSIACGMDRFLTWLGAASAALLTVAIAVPWWEHRKRMAEMRRELAWSENSRFALEEHAKTVEVRLQAINANIESQMQELHSVRDITQRRQALEGALQRMSQPATAADAQAGAWIDTEPMVLATSVPPRFDPPHFDPTEPAELSQH